ncbi:L-seryl-tRNA(Sec) selenium transferase, partial [Kocuria oceani]
MRPARRGGTVAQDDPRRLIPRTDQLMGLPAVRRARERLSEEVVRSLVRGTQERARRGELTPDQVEPAV